MLDSKLRLALVLMEILLQASGRNFERFWDLVPEVEYEKEKICLIKYTTRFYVFDLTHIFSGVNRWDCLLLCQRVETCRSANHNSNLNLCILSSTNQDQQKSFIDLGGWYHFEFSKCNQKARRSSLLIDNGEYHSGWCGVPSFPNDDYPRVSKRIIRGQPVSPFAYPWMGRFAMDGIVQTECSLFLILKNAHDQYTEWALSAAHCVINNKHQLHKLHFVFGTYDSRYSTTHEVRRTAESFYFVGQYITSRIDLVLVKLSDKVYFNDYIKPVCLPHIGEKPLSNHCWVSGWGRITENREAYQLEHLKVNIRPLGFYNGQPRDRDKLVILRHLGNFGSPYSGDSGSPLACKNLEGRFVAYGILESIRDFDLGYDSYSHFVKVADFVQWIKDAMLNDSQLVLG